MSDLQAFVVFGFFAVLFNLGLTLLNFKLYTEFAKQRMQEQRIIPRAAKDSTHAEG